MGIVASVLMLEEKLVQNAKSFTSCSKLPCLPHPFRHLRQNTCPPKHNCYARQEHGDVQLLYREDELSHIATNLLSRDW